MVNSARRRLLSLGQIGHKHKVIKPDATEGQSMPHMPQRMPWAVEESLFIEKCTRCEKCVSACETAIIVKGSGGFPEVDFHLGECTFCGKCAKVCTDNAFRLITEPPWQQTVAIEGSCLALKGIECRSCLDNCEPRAIRFEMQLGGVAKPKIIKQDCNGCGACIGPCPVNALHVQLTQSN